jgi:lipopolysaccharide export LptBFGC system permease protein LptF
LIRTLDRYVLRTFISALTIFFFGIVGLYVIVDASFKQTRKLVRQERDVLDIITFMVNYYFYHLPVITYDVLPGIVLIAGIFALTILMRNNEMVPILASGVSIYRVIVPILLLSVLISVLQWNIKEHLIPHFSGRIIELRQKAKRQETALLRKVAREDGLGNYFWIPRYDRNIKKMEQVQVTSYKEALGVKGAYKELLVAQSAIYKRAPNGLKAWVFSNGSRMTIDPRSNQLVKRGPVFGKDGFALVPDVQTGESLGVPNYMLSDLRPEDVESQDPSVYRELYSIKKLEELGTHYKLQPPWIRLELWRRVTWPLVGVMLLVMGMPLVLVRQSTNIYMSIGICLVLCIAFFMVNYVCLNLGMQGHLSPWLAALLPFTIFGSLGGLLFMYVKT